MPACASWSNVGLDYLTLGRAAATLSGGEAQRIRLATQIGAGLMGVLYILDEPSIGLHQRDNNRLIETLERLRDLGNTVIVVEHDEDTIRGRRLRRRHGPRRRRARRARRGRRHAGRRSPPARESVTGAVPHRAGASVRLPEPDAATRARAPSSVTGAAANNLKNVDVPRSSSARSPWSRACRARARARSSPTPWRPRSPTPSTAPSARSVRTSSSRASSCIDKVVDIDQSPDRAARRARTRPPTSGVLGRPAQRSSPSCPRAEGARLRARALLVQRAGRPLRGLQGRRPAQDRDELPARRLRALRGLPRQALQPRDARGALQAARPSRTCST